MSDSKVGLQSSTRGIGKTCGALESMVRMIGYWNAYKLDIPMQLLMVMAMVQATAMMNTSEQNPLSMQPSKDEAHIVTGGVGRR